MITRDRWITQCGAALLSIILFPCCNVLHPMPYCFLDSESIKEISSVAVLPFHNLTKKVNAGVIMTNTIMAELIESGRFSVAKFGDVRLFFLRRRMTSVSTIDKDTLRSLRDEFKVDAVIMGTVLEYEEGDITEKKNRGTSPPFISIGVAVLDTRTGRVLAQGEFIEKGSAAGYLMSNHESISAFALCKRIAQKLIVTIGAEGA